MAMILEWSEHALTTLDEIYHYLKEEAGKRTARKIIDNIYNHSGILIQNPKAGTREELLSDLPQEFRYLVEGNYKILYFIVDEKIYISSVFDCRQNPERMKNEIIK